MLHVPGLGPVLMIVSCAIYPYLNLTSKLREDYTEHTAIERQHVTLGIGELGNHHELGALFG